MAKSAQPQARSTCNFTHNTGFSRLAGGNTLTVSDISLKPSVFFA